MTTILKPPLKDFRIAKYPLGVITQFFGENVALYKSINIGLEKGHNGWDCIAPWGTPMYAVEDGTVVEVRTDPSGYGMHVRLVNTDITREWTYGHCSAIGVTVGEKVKTGQVLATMGNTGFVVSGNTPYWKTNPSAGSAHPGTHLHFGLRNIKKSSRGWAYPGTTIKFEVLNYDNGYKGAVDPLPHFLDATKKSYKILKIASDKQDKNLYRIAMWMQSVGL